VYDRQVLIDLFRERALKLGEFVLASGKNSSYFLDGKQITLDATGLRLVSEGMLELLGDVQFDAIGGVPIGADPIIGGMLTIAAMQGQSLHGFLVRKESKRHGTDRLVEGPVKPGMDVVIVEDVVTTGGSSFQAIDRVEEFGCNVVHVAAIVDRMEGGAAKFCDRGIPFRALLTIEDFGISPPVE